MNGSPAGGHLAHAELLEEQQAVRVGPVLGELAAGDTQGVGACEDDPPADRAMIKLGARDRQLPLRGLVPTNAARLKRISPSR